MRFGFAATAAAMTVSIVLAGCGSGSPSPEEEARDVFERVRVATNAGDGKTVCSLLTPNSIREIEKPPDAAELRAYREGGNFASKLLGIPNSKPDPAGPGSCARQNSDPIAEIPSRPFDRVELDGDEATVVHLVEDDGRQFEFATVVRLIDGQWKVDLPRTVDRLFEDARSFD